MRADDNARGARRAAARLPREDQPVIELFQRKEFVARVDATRSIETIQSEIRTRFSLP